MGDVAYRRWHALFCTYFSGGSGHDFICQARVLVGDTMSFAALRHHLSLLLMPLSSCYSIGLLSLVHITAAAGVRAAFWLSTSGDKQHRRYMVDWISEVGEQLSLQVSALCCAMLGSDGSFASRRSDEFVLAWSTPS